VEDEAERQGVDPDMVKAILYYENADGHKLGLDALADTVGRSRSQRPMSIRSDMWGGLGISRHSSPAENIRASVTLIRRIIDRLNNPTPEKVGTLWNSISQEKITTEGARIGRIYRERPWQRKGSGEPSDSLPLLP
jgi:hypothetical protein